MGRIAMVSLHTSPLDQPGTGDAGGMNVYVIELSRRLAAQGIAVDVFTRATSSSLPQVVEAAAIPGCSGVDRDAALEVEPGFNEFLQDRTLSGDVTRDETEFLSRLRFRGKRPGPLYYYRELQNLRDPLHFRAEES